MLVTFFFFGGGGGVRKGGKLRSAGVIFQKLIKEKVIHKDMEKEKTITCLFVTS